MCGPPAPPSSGLPRDRVGVQGTDPNPTLPSVRASSYRPHDLLPVKGGRKCATQEKGLAQAGWALRNFLNNARDGRAARFLSIRRKEKKPCS